MSGNNSVVECNLAKVEVAGSNPVSRSKDCKAPEPTVPGLFVLCAGFLKQVSVEYNSSRVTGADSRGGFRQEDQPDLSAPGPSVGEGGGRNETRRTRDGGRNWKGCFCRV
jgi:hypothetical protein